MKVILIKKCKDGDVNDVIDVAPGYASNFLIKNGFALPWNKKTVVHNQKRLDDKREIEQKKTTNAIANKKVIEAIELVLALKTSNDVAHGVITKRQILDALKIKGITLDKHSIESVKINSLGDFNIKVSLYNTISAMLKVKVVDNG